MSGIIHKIEETLHIGGEHKGEHKAHDHHKGEHKGEHGHGDHKEKLKDKIHGEHGHHGDHKDGHDKKKKDKKKKHGEHGHEHGHGGDHSSSESDSKVSVPGKPPIQIREFTDDVITLAGSTDQRGYPVCNRRKIKQEWSSWIDQEWSSFLLIDYQMFTMKEVLTAGAEVSDWSHLDGSSLQA
ncbi:hypothetical protein ACFE04_027514 [Oxalis oulophora]